MEVLKSGSCPKRKLD